MPNQVPVKDVSVCPRCHLPLAGCDFCKGDQEADAKPPTVGERLAALGKIYDDRAAVYGDNYKHFGTAMMGLFPRGLTLSTAEDFNRLGLFFHVASKLSRYAQCLARGESHADSCDDGAVYFQMMRECDDAEK